MTDETGQAHDRPITLERMPTGVHGLDIALGGGFARGGTYLVMGRPGTGKTTLGNQLAFHQVKSGGRAVYLTLLAESHASMLRNLQTMRFFDADAINRDLVYVGAYRALRDEKLKGLLALVRRVIRDEKASLLVLDGISPARAYAETDVALKEFILELQVLGAMTNCTTILLANMTADDANGAEHTMVDGLVELAFERSSRRTHRTLEVIKLRGTAHLLGRHEVSITADGMTVHPRIEDVLQRHGQAPQQTRGVTGTGIAQLDEMLTGGFPTGTTSVVLGFTGSGKTTLATHFLHAGLAAGEPALYFGFYESPARILDAAENIGLPLRDHVATGLFAQIWQPPYEHGLDALADLLLSDVAKRHVRRIVIDGLDGFRQASMYPDRTIRFLTALSNELRALDVTTLITEETVKMNGPDIDMRVEGVSSLVDGILMLEYLTVGSEQRRLISVIKSRGAPHASRMREMTLTSKGIAVSVDSASAEQMLSGGSGVLSTRRGARSWMGA